MAEMSEKDRFLYDLCIIVLSFCDPRMKRLSPFFPLCVSLLLLPLAAFAQVSVTTWQADNAHTGNNAKETILTPGTVSSPGNFGLVFSQTLDGQTYGQPLVAAGIKTTDGTTHNVVYVATQHGSIYAFDADNNTGTNASALWHLPLLPAGTVPCPQSVVGSSDISVELGITTTPVIDPASSTIYIVSKVQRTSDTTYHQFLYALDLATGAAKFGSPVEINPTFIGNSSDRTSPGVIPFNPLREHLRGSMAINNGILYLVYASHSDTTPYHGEIVTYNAGTLQLLKTFNAMPLATLGGIWMSGAGPAIDADGNVFVATGNGNWGDPNNASATTFPAASYPYGTDYSHSVLKLPPDTFTVTSANPLNWFTPYYWDSLNNGDLDLGCGGITLLPDQSGPHTHILVVGSKGGVMYVVDRDNLGGINNPDNSIQEIPELNGKSFFCTPAYYNGFLYYSPSGGPLTQRTVGYNATDHTYVQANNPIISSDIYNNNKGSGCFISSNGTTNGIVWILKGDGFRAYNASNVSAAALFTGNATLPGNISCQTAKFTVPVVANGKMYYTGFESNNTGHLFVNGILPTATGTPTAPSNAVATTNSAGSITVQWTTNSTNESGFKINRSTSATSGFTQVNLTGAGITTFTDTGLNASTTYYYQVVATNSAGDSRATNVASATTFPTYAENGLVAYWNLDQANGTTEADSTANGHTGTLHGETTSGADGFINSGVNFHGTGQSASDITVPNKADLQFTAAQSFTLAAWVLPQALRGKTSNIEETIFAKSRDTGNYYGVWLNTSDQWVFRGPGGDVVGSTATEGAWTHVAVVQDGTANTRKIYVNGQQVGSTGTAQAGDGTGDFYMARQNVTGNIEGFPGTLDEVRLYSRALAAGEIANLMGPPVLGGQSVQTQGNAGSFGKTIWPVTASKAIEGRKGSTAGSYNLVLSFSAPVSGITGSLRTQGGGAAVGSVKSVSYDTTGKVVTVTLTGVGNAQALDLHLTGILPGNGSADIPFNVLWGDLNGDNVVNNLDASIVTHSHTSLVNAASAFYDLNGDGVVDASDDALVNAAVGTSLGAQTETNLAIFQLTKSLSDNGTNTSNLAVDNDLTTRWESVQQVDPEWIYVDLGSVCVIQSVLIYWENAGGKDYQIQTCDDGTSWVTRVPVTGNTVTQQYLTYPLNVSNRYVRIYGTARTSGTGASGYGYSMYDFQVLGLSGTGAIPAPTVNSATAANALTGNAFSYQITATNTPTGYNATGLPTGLGINTGTGVISGTPTQTGTSNVALSALNATGAGTATLTLAVQAPYTAWQNLNFTSAELAKPTVSGPMATPAGDGITNLMKYALNLTAKVNGTGGLPTESTTSTGGQRYLTLTYTRPVTDADISYFVEVSGDMQTWNSGSGATATVSTTNSTDGKTQTVVVRDLTAASSTARQRFIRLRVTMP